MRTGGTEAKTGDELDEELESMAAAVSVSIGTDSASATCGALKEDFPKVLAIFADVLMKPAFRKDKLDLAKQQALSLIERRNDEPDAIATREAKRLLYGDASPYGFTAEVATIRSIERDDLVAFHARHFHPDRTAVGVVGDFDAKAMRAAIEKTFAAWPRAAADDPEPAFPEATEAQVGGVFLVSKPDVNQATIILGHLGVKRDPDDPDYPAAVVADSILGGGLFTSRLFNKVRTELGLAYGVGSFMRMPYSYRGGIGLVCQTKSETTIQAIRALRTELDRMLAEKPSAEELAIAKDGLLQSLVFENDSREEIVSRALGHEYHRVPQDMLERFQKGLEKVTADDVLRVARKLFHPERLTTLVVGNDAKFDGDLASVATGGGDGAGGAAVVRIDVSKPASGFWTPPAVPGEATVTWPPTAEALAKGREAIARALERAGGREALAAVKGVRTVGKVLMKGPQGSIPMGLTQVVVFPDKLRQELSTPMGKVVMGYDGKKGWFVFPGAGPQEVPESQLEELKREVERNPLRTLLALAGPDAEVAHAGEAKVVELAAVAVAAEKGALTLRFDAETYDLLEEERPEEAQAVRYGDYREVPAGARKVRLPFELRQLQAGLEAATVKVDKLELDPDVPADAFEMPNAPAKPDGN